MSLDLSPEIEIAIRERADAEGVSVNDLLTRTFALKRQQISHTYDAQSKVQSMLEKWQAADNTPIMPPIQTRTGETATRALFRRWKDEDAHMTDQEKDAEDRMWEEIEDGLMEHRLTFDAARSTS